MNSTNKYFQPTAETETMRVYEQLMVDVFRQYGYREIETPILDSAAIFETGEEQAAFRLMDPQGQIRVLRPDWTTPIAQWAAGLNNTDIFPLRVFYRGSVFRRDGQQAREMHQTGVEMLGADGDLADGEVVSLAVRVLAAAGLKRFRIGMGHGGFLAGLLEYWEIPRKESDAIQEALGQKDLVTFRYRVESLRIDSAQKNFLQQLPDLSGHPQILDQARKASPGTAALQALDTLEHVFQDLQGAGLDHHIYLDLGMIRDQNYYTGIVFEGYTQGLGHPVLGGGRYDRLAHRFGADLTATGFAVHMERLLAVTPDRGDQHPPEILVIPARGDEAEAVREAGRLRQEGHRVLLEISGRSQAEARRFAQGQGCKKMRYLQNDQWIDEDLLKGAALND